MKSQKSHPEVHHGMNRLDLDRVLKSVGGSVSTQRGTGEIVYTHPSTPHRVRANGRRKDATRRQTRFVLDILQRYLAANEQVPAANDPTYDVNK